MSPFVSVPTLGVVLLAAAMRPPLVAAPRAADAITITIHHEAFSQLGLVLVGELDENGTLLFRLRKEASSGFLSSNPSIDFDQASLAALDRALTQLEKAGPGLEKTLQAANGAELRLAYVEAVAAEGEAEAVPAHFQLSRESRGLFSSSTVIHIGVDQVAAWRALGNQMGPVVDAAKTRLRAALAPAGAK